MAVNYIITEALALCAHTLIPSVFPFMVLTNLLISCGFDSMLKRVIGKPFEALFHLNANLASAYVIGLISGYPQGAYAVTQIYLKGGCTKEEAEHGVVLCNNTGPAFMISAVGSLFCDMRLGYTMFILQTAVVALYAVITRPKRLSRAVLTEEENAFSLEVIPRAVSGSVLPMLNVCGFVVIFALICSWVSRLPIGCGVRAILYSMLEITNAVKYISTDLPSLPVLGFALFWSGACIHMQSASVVGGAFSMKRYYVAKLIESVAVFLILYLKNLFF